MAKKADSRSYPKGYSSLGDNAPSLIISPNERPPQDILSFWGRKRRSQHWQNRMHTWSQLCRAYPDICRRINKKITKQDKYSYIYFPLFRSEAHNTYSRKYRADKGYTNEVKPTLLQQRQPTVLAQRIANIYYSDNCDHPGCLPVRHFVHRNRYYNLTKQRNDGEKHFPSW